VPDPDLDCDLLVYEACGDEPVDEAAVEGSDM
jgi:hypothetical protein